MHDQAHLDAYVDAQNAAHSELEQLSEELTQLWIRKDLLEKAVETLAAFADREDRPAESFEHFSTPPVESSRIALVPDPPPSFQSVEPATPEFADRDESARDALQRRINSALGLAVA